MKKRVLVFVLTMVMAFGLFQSSAMAYKPASPGLWIEGVRYSTAHDGFYHKPDDADYISNTVPFVNNQNNQTVTVNIPKNAQYVMFRYWDYGNSNGISYPNNGFITGGVVTYKINDVKANGKHMSGGIGSDSNLALGSNVYAFKEYITFKADKFEKINDTDTFTVNTVRTVQGVRYDYTITYNINWQEPKPNVAYDRTRHWLTGLDSSMEFSSTDANNTWGSWFYYSSGSNINYNMYPKLNTTIGTSIKVRFQSNKSEDATWTYKVPALKPAESGLYIGQNSTDGRMVLRGLQKGKYYAWSLTPEFRSFTHYYNSEGYGGVYLNEEVKPGDTIYVRTAINNSSISSDYVALTAPALLTLSNEGLESDSLDLESLDLNLLVANPTDNVIESNSNDNQHFTTNLDEDSLDETFFAPEHNEFVTFIENGAKEIITITYDDGTKCSIIYEE